MKEFHVQIGKKGVKITPDNCGIALFRDEPDKDYLDIWEEKDDGEHHMWVFGRRELLIWMGRVCLREQDRKILHRAERNGGTFRDHAGDWNPSVFVEDTANDTENELYTQYLLNDLTSFTGVDDLPGRE